MYLPIFLTVLNLRMKHKYLSVEYEALFAFLIRLHPPDLLQFDTDMWEGYPGTTGY